MAQVLFTGYGEQLIAAATNVTNSTKDSVTKRKAQRTPAYAISTLIYRASYVSNGPPDDDSVPLVPTAVPSDVSFVPPKIGCSCCCSTAQFSTIEKGGGFPVNASSG